MTKKIILLTLSTVFSSGAFASDLHVSAHNFIYSNGGNTVKLYTPLLLNLDGMISEIVPQDPKMNDVDADMLHEMCKAIGFEIAKDVQIIPNPEDSENVDFVKLKIVTKIVDALVVDSFVVKSFLEHPEFIIGKMTCTR